MTDILQSIMARKRLEIEADLPRARDEDWSARARDLPPAADFLAALRGHPRIRVIAEIKKASPSAGVIRADFEPATLARSYQRGGAACLSVLTDEPFFQGHLDHLRLVSRTVPLPLLRKDFVLDPIQIAQARLAGAAAVLLIAECLSAGELADHVGRIRDLGMTPLVELHQPEHLPAVIASGTPLIGINNRDLRAFETRLETTLDLVPAIPKDRTIVSESGIRTRADVARLERAGVHAMLIGETFMRAPDPGAALAELLTIEPTDPAT